MSPLSDSINKTLSYFSLFNYPLTKEELFACLWQPPRISYEEFILSLREESEANDEAIPSSSFAVTNQKYGYYFLPGQEVPAENRRRRLLASEIKMKIARRAAKKIRAVPFLRAVFVCNSVGQGMAGSDSDIDFFIIAAPGRVWLVRFFTNLILRFWRLRTYGKNQRDKICLSFYVDENHLDLKPLCAVKEDIHFIYWLHQMIPVFDPENFYRKFLDSNRWTGEYLPNINRKSAGGYIFQVAESGFSRGWKRAWESMWGGAYGGLLEHQAKAILTQRLKPGVKDAAARGDNSVVISDSVIKLHENDKRREYWERWR